mmetsp:Transcript_92204/g.256644  ORF Transcript_92204/g.256644 Transcript_92204/m.256644 type:complete len:154 (+) Transcript_92204:125-586(+)
MTLRPISTSARDREIAIEALRNGGYIREGELQNISYRPRLFGSRVLEEMVLLGFMGLRSRHFREWRDRWATLTVRHVLFFEYPGNYQGVPVESVALEEVREVVVNEEWVKLATPRRQHPLRYDRPDLAVSWALRMCALAPTANCVEGTPDIRD